LKGLVENLKARASVLRRMRAFFDGLGFTEVTTPVRISAPAPEPHIDCPPSGDKFLRASPELQMKKLLAAGMDRIYQIGPCFREGEFGARHNPEFTMLEWYRLGASYLDIADDAEALVRAELKSAGPAERIAVRDAYAKWAGWDPWAGWDQERFDFDMAAKIEPNLPRGLVFLMDYPKEAASLARLRGDVAERWELYFDGIEFANCFTELCDGAEQRRRFSAAREERRRLGESDYPLDEEFLELLPLVKSAAGVALGVDRLVAASLGESDIHSALCAE
jgi:lysyl-tRNA synthetase class 2